MIVRLSLGLVVLGGLLAWPHARAADSTGQALFEKRCSVCHQLPNPEQPPEVGWEDKLQIMARAAGLDPDQKQEVLDYLLSHTRDAAMDASLDEDRLLFEQKCSRCHTLDRVLLSELNGDALRHVVNRMQSRSGTNWLSDREVERIFAYLSNVPREGQQADTIGDGATGEQIFAVRCSACHSLERVFSKLEDAEGTAADEFWSHTVSRMQGKAPQWMAESEANQILEYLLSTSAPGD